MERTAGRAPNIVPNIGASGPSELFRQALGTPILWLPFSYGGCNQHGPDEHGLQSLFRDGLAIMTGLWWDIGAHGEKRIMCGPGSVIDGPRGVTHGYRNVGDTDLRVT